MPAGGIGRVVARRSQCDLLVPVRWSDLELLGFLDAVNALETFADLVEKVVLEVVPLSYGLADARVSEGLGGATEPPGRESLVPCDESGRRTRVRGGVPRVFAVVSHTVTVARMLAALPSGSGTSGCHHRHRTQCLFWERGRETPGARPCSPKAELRFAAGRPKTV